MSPRARLLFSLIALLTVFAIGTVGFAVLEGASLFDAAYMAAITVSTVGYGEHIRLDHSGRVWTILLIVFGIGVTSIAFTSLISVFVSGDVRDLVGRRKLESMINKLTNHVIMCGYGRMGALTVADLKRENVPLVVIERSASLCEKLKSDGTLFVQGDATEEDVLMRARLKQCRALVTTLPHDADNVYVVLTAHGMRPDLPIISRAEQASTESKLRHAGATSVISPHLVGARRITNLLTRPSVVEFLEVASSGIELEVDELAIREGSPLCDTTLRDAPIRETAGAMVIAIKHADGSAVYHPGPDACVRAGDVLIMIGKSGLSDRLRRLVTPSP